MILFIYCKDWRDDIKGAIDAGMKAILVKTGKYRNGDENNLDKMSIVADDFSVAVDYILNNYYKK